MKLLKSILPLALLCALAAPAAAQDTLSCYVQSTGVIKPCPGNAKLKSTFTIALASIPTLDASHLPFSLPLSRANGGVGADISGLGTGLLVQTAANSWAVRSVVGGTGITITNGSGAAGNPSVALTSSSLTVAAGNGLSASGCGPVSLGGTCTVSAATSNRQVFTTPGTNTWTKPTYCNVVILECLGAGGGGGSGGRGPTKTGGSGGWGGGYGFDIVPCASLSATENVIVGGTHAAATAVTTDNTDGTQGSQGDDSYVQHSGSGYLAFAPGGPGGVGGTTANPTPSGTSAFYGVLRPVAPGPGNLGAGKNSGASTSSGGGSEAGYYMMGAKAGGSGGGGGGTNSGTASAGGVGRCPGSYGFSASSFNAGGSAPGGSGSTGAASSFIPIANTAGCGGGGGASSGDGVTAGGAGGNGDGFGAGGGGGGASANGANSGRGGQSSGGICWLSTF